MVSMKNFVRFVLFSTLINSLCNPMAAKADSMLVDPAAAGSAAVAHLDFAITITQTLFLRVSAGAANNASSSTVDTLTFEVPAANAGNGNAVGGTGGDLAAGSATVRVYGNGGSISLNSATTGPLTSAAGDTLSWNQISVLASPLPSGSAGFANAGVPHPAFNTGPAGGIGAAITLESASKVVRVEGRWTYGYLNANPVPAGTYGATAARNGRVTYTATQL